MIKKEHSILSIVSFSLIMVSGMTFWSCKSHETAKASFDAFLSQPSEIDVNKISTATSIQFKIIKTEEIGFFPKQKFFWIITKDILTLPKLETLASAIIAETIKRRPQTYHGFTIHFICEAGFGGTLENSKCFAKATYSPDGVVEKIGRVPIDDYKGYKLICTFSYFE